MIMNTDYLNDELIQNVTRDHNSPRPLFIMLDHIETKQNKIFAHIRLHPPVISSTNIALWTVFSFYVSMLQGETCNK